MRDIKEIIKAHDILDAILQGDIPSNVKDEIEAFKNMTVACRVLCWILEHNRGKWFEDRLTDIEADLFAKGYQIHENFPIDPI